MPNGKLRNKRFIYVLCPLKKKKLLSKSYRSIISVTGHFYKHGIEAVDLSIILGIKVNVSITDTVKKFLYIFVIY